MKYLLLMLIAVPAFADVSITKPKLTTIHFTGADLTDIQFQDGHVMAADTFVGKLPLNEKIDLNNVDVILAVEEDFVSSWILPADVSVGTKISGSNLTVQFVKNHVPNADRKFHVTFATKN